MSSVGRVILVTYVHANDASFIVDIEETWRKGADECLIAGFALFEFERVDEVLVG